ncbi:hypothetical protein C5167_007186 [Papaver somniferum]|uniref:Mitochondrial import inner membrane translocase subunit TIM50 n=1 Tax=Papaver somniferum TaxID=3469 RepID=A0A4Y7JFN5_PAPSO|nr:hypothetical protein C5167_007186 [Papaver somniferum]
MGDMKKNLLFCWDQYHCTDTGYSTLENRQKPLVLKELKKLWNKHEQSLPWEKGAYNESNTILLDDSPYKALRNPPHTAIFPPPYRFEDAGDKSLGPGGDLRVYLEGLLKAEDVQNYVEQHRFGQRAITDKNPSWGFYLRIIVAQGPNIRDPDQGTNQSLRIPLKGEPEAVQNFRLACGGSDASHAVSEAGIIILPQHMNAGDTEMIENALKKSFCQQG